MAAIHESSDDCGEDGDGVPCPSCERSFDTKHGMRSHHTQAHGKSLVTETVECDQCGSEFEPRSDATGRFCSRECHAAFERGPRVEVECRECGEVFEAPPSDDRKYCSQKCTARAFRDRETRECGNCGRMFQVQVHRDAEYCCRECESEARLDRPRPSFVPMLCWLLYEYEGFSLEETYRRQRAVLGHDSALTQDSVRELLKALGVFHGQGAATYERELRQLDPDDIGEFAVGDDDGWQEYYQTGGAD